MQKQVVDKNYQYCYNNACDSLTSTYLLLLECFCEAFMAKSFSDLITAFNSNKFIIASDILLGIASFIFAIAMDNIIVKIVCFVSLAAAITISLIIFIRRKYAADKITDELLKKIAEKKRDASIHIHDFMFSATKLGLQIKNTKTMTELQYKTICESLCTSMRILLNEIYGKSINVCIKMIDTDSIMDTKYKEWKTKTLARACDKKREREVLDEQKQVVSNNTSFLNILDPEKNDLFFASPNIRETIRKLKDVGIEYRNPNENFEDYYTSTIVTPISMKTSLVSPTITDYAKMMNNDSSQYHIIGFLCIDSEYDFTNEKGEFLSLTYDCMTLSTLLYSMFENRIINQLEKADM